VRLYVDEANKQLALPEFGDKIAGLRVVDFGATPLTEDPLRGGFSSSRWYKLRADISGSYVLPSLSLTYQLEGKEESARTSEIFVEVTAPGAAAANAAEGEKKSDDAATPAQTDIRDIKDIIPLPDPRWWLYGIIATGVLLPTALGIWYFLRRRRRPVPELPVIPHEDAEASLAALLASDFLEQGRDKEFHFALSAIIRLYFERQFAFPASDRTLEEIKRSIANVAGLDAVLAADFIAILSDSDLVKFTDTQCAKERSLALLHRAGDFVRKTAPQSVTQDSVV
jgi:hypothetical protein